MKIGFIGMGNMGFALAKGFSASDGSLEIGYLDPKVNSEEFRRFSSYKELADWSGTIFLAVKPQVCEEVLREISAYLSDEKHLLVSIVAGLTGERIRKICDETNSQAKFRRYIVAMPNTPMLVREGVCCYYPSDGATELDIEEVEKLFGSVGLVQRVSVKLMDTVPAISGSAPAYVYELIRAMGQAGIEQGFAGDVAYKLAAQTVLGAAKMVLETGEHPDVLQDRVCSPGGSTIEAVLALKENGFERAVHKAMESCTAKIIKMKNDC